MLLLAVGLLGFVGLLVMGAYAPDLRSGRNGGAHALSTAAVGYSGIVALIRATGAEPTILRDPDAFDMPDLLIVTPESGSVNITAAIKDSDDDPVLFVLPKWRTAPDPDRTGWVRKAGLIPLYEPIGVLSPEYRFGMRQYGTRGQLLLSDRSLPATVRFRAPRQMQVITDIETDKTRMNDPAYREAVTLHPLITDGHGGILLARMGKRALFVLADPDLLNNMGMKDARQAVSAVRLLQWLNYGTLGGISFDVSFNGFTKSRSPLKLLFEPPFAAMMLTIVAALLLAGVQAFARFGPERARRRAIAFGKAALVDNSAALIRRAGREARMGGRYAAVIREWAAHAFSAPASLRDGALDDYLDALKGPHRFTELAADATDADNRQSLLAAAQALHAWKGEKIR
jgi:hypothetical protein